MTEAWPAAATTTSLACKTQVERLVARVLLQEEEAEVAIHWRTSEKALVDGIVLSGCPLVI